MLLVAVGAFAHLGLDVAGRLDEQGYGVTVVDPRWVRPVPVELVGLAAQHRLVVVVEDGVRAGGVGDAVAQLLRDGGVDTPVHQIGVEPGWHPHGTRDEILADLGLTAQDVARQVTGWMAALGAPLEPRWRPAAPQLVDHELVVHDRPRFQNRHVMITGILAEIRARRSILASGSWDPDRSGQPWRPRPGWRWRPRSPSLALLALSPCRHRPPRRPRTSASRCGRRRSPGTASNSAATWSSCATGSTRCAARDAHTGRERWRLQTPGEPLTHDRVRARHQR